MAGMIIKMGVNIYDAHFSIAYLSIYKLAAG